MKATATPLHPNPNAVSAVADAPPAPKWAGAVEESRDIVRGNLARQNLPGLSVAVGVGSGLVWAEGFGFADLEKRVPVTPNHRFRIGSASSVLTSAAAGLLLEKGDLNLDDVIEAYVREFPQKQWPVTLRQVMSHTSGLASDGGDEGPLFEVHCEKPVEALRHFASSPLLFEPGTEFRFSNYGFILVSAAIESAAKKPFLSYMKERVFDPLEMRDTMADSGARPDPKRATSYFPRFIEEPRYGPEPMRDLDYSCYAGASVFVSTPSDLVRFGLAVQNGKLLKRDTVQQLQTAQRLTSGTETSYGLGWHLETITLNGAKTRVAGHDGNLLGGMMASFLTFPDHGIVVAVISNISHANTFALAARIAEAFARQHKTPAKANGRPTLAVDQPLRAL